MLSFFLTSCKDSGQNSQHWQIVLRTNAEGAIIKGSKNDLIKAIRSGADVKIGWGHKGEKHTIEHLSEPIWLAILDEKEVMVNLHPQSLAEINWDSLEGHYSDVAKLHEEWRVVITTKGSFDAIWYDRKRDSLIRRVPQIHEMTWFIRQNQKLDSDKLYVN